MKIALCSDEWHEVKQYVQDWLKKRGFKCVLLGSFVSHQNEPWVESAVKAALSVAAGECSEGIFFLLRVQELQLLLIKYQVLGQLFAKTLRQPLLQEFGIMQIFKYFRTEI